jgi:hypothetical protein
MKLNQNYLLTTLSRNAIALDLDPKLNDKEKDKGKNKNKKGNRDKVWIRLVANSIDACTVS